MPLNLFGPDTTLERVIQERRKDAGAVSQLETGKLPGRFRTGFRAAPASSTDLIAGDALGDVVTDATYIYTLINVSGSLVWDRRSHSTGW